MDRKFNRRNKSMSGTCSNIKSIRKFNNSQREEPYNTVQLQELDMLKNEPQFSYPQGDYKINSLQNKFSQQSPFYLRKHMTIRARYANEQMKLSTLQDARARYEQSLKET